MNPQLKPNLEQAAKAIAGASQLGVLCHTSPDGDALGSALGFAVAARRAGKQVVVSFGEPFETSDSFSYLPLSLLVTPSEFPKVSEVLVIFDAADISRLGSLAGRVSQAGTVVVVDHHITNHGFGDITLIDDKAAASAQLAYYLIKRLGWAIDAEVATCLHTGLVADTGRFQYAATSPEVLRVGAALLEAGARPEQIGQALYEAVPFGYLALSARVLGRAVLEPELDLVWSELGFADLKAAGVSYADADRLIDDLRIAREAEVALLLKEVSAGVKGSLRSRGRVDVAAIASQLGGGGHARASGFTHRGPSAAVVEAVRKALGHD